MDDVYYTTKKRKTPVSPQKIFVMYTTRKACQADTPNITLME